MTDQLCTCEEVEAQNCSCSFADSDCFSWGGSGNTNPLAVTAILDPNTNNLVTCASGLLLQLPTAIRTPPSCQAYNSVHQSITHDTGTVVDLNSERYDNGTMHSTVTDNSRITFTTAGVYIVTFLGSFAGNVTGDRQALIRANGSEFLGGIERKALSSATPEFGMQVTVQEEFEIGDWVEAVVKQKSGGALNLLATRYSPILTAHYRRGPTDD